MRFVGVQGKYAKRWTVHGMEQSNIVQHSNRFKPIESATFAIDFGHLFALRCSSGCRWGEYPLVQCMNLSRQDNTYRPRLDFTSLPQTSNFYRLLHLTMDRKDGQGHHSDSLVQDIKWHILSARISSRKYWMQDLVDPAKALLPLRQWGETHAVHIQKEDVFATHFSFFQFCILSKQEEKQCLLIDSNPSMIIIKYVLYWTICACTCTYMYMHMTCTYMYRYFIHDTRVTSSKNME